MFRSICLTVAAALTACAPQAPRVQPAGHQPAEEAAVLAVMDAYMREISANDLAAMDARQTQEGMTYRHVALEDGGWDVVPAPTSTGSRRSVPTNTHTTSDICLPPS